MPGVSAVGAGIGPGAGAGAGAGASGSGFEVADAVRTANLGKSVYDTAKGPEQKAPPPLKEEPYETVDNKFLGAKLPGPVEKNNESSVLSSVFTPSAREKLKNATTYANLGTGLGYTGYQGYG